MNDASDRRRLLLALEAGAHAPPGLLAAAVGVAAALQADLDTLLVEDENIVHAARLPDTWLVPAHGTSTKLFDDATIRRAFRVRLDDLRKRLAMQADARALRWSVRTESGDLAERLTEPVNRADTIVVAHVRRRRMADRLLPGATDRGRLLLYNRDAQLGARIIALYRGDAAVLDAAHVLATGVDLPLEVLALASDLDDLQARAADAEDWLLGHGLEIVPGGMLTDPAGHWREQIMAAEPATFVLAPDADVLSEAAIAELADSKSVMIVSA